MSHSWWARPGVVVVALSCGCAVDSIGPARSVATDAGAEAAFDVPSDVATDADAEAAFDVPSDVATDAGAEAAFDAPREVATDAGAEAAFDAPREVGADSGAVIGINPIVIENARPGTEAWQLIRPSENHEVEGYASTTSTAVGQSFDLFVNVPTTHDVRWEAYRIGYYQGLGGRLIASGGPRSIARQARCPVDTTNGMVECHWSAAFTVVPDVAWATGAYLIKLLRDDGYDSYVPVIVRESAPRSPLLFQASVNTWQAYNDWGDTSLYVNRVPASGFSGELLPSA